MSELITVPTFTFDQGNIYDGAEPHIQVCYWENGDSPLISLDQSGNSINFTSIVQLKQLVKLIDKNLDEATRKLKK